MNTALSKSLTEGAGLGWKLILVPTNFSEWSKPAMDTAAYLAAKCGAKITLLHVVQACEVATFEAGIAMSDVADSIRAALDELCSGVPPALIQDKIVRVGAQATVREIIETARAVSADLIVAATHPYSPFKRVMLGSRTEELVHHAPCAVLIVRATDGAGPGLVHAGQKYQATGPKSGNSRPADL